MNKKIVITADDYGMCPEVNQAINEGIKNGHITSTNVLVNMGDYSELKPLQKSYNVSIGVHLNITDGKSTLNHSQIPTLVDENDNFNSIKEFKKRWKKKQINKEDVVAELKNQYEIFVAHFGKPDYWNSHENICLPLDVFKLFDKVAKQYDVLSTRSFKRVYVDKDRLTFKRRLREILVATYYNVLFGKLKSKGYKNPDGRFICFNIDDKYDINKVKEAINKTNKQFIEYVVHPSIEVNAELFGNLTDSRLKDYNLINNTGFFAELENNGAIFTNFKCEKYGEKL